MSNLTRLLSPKQLLFVSNALKTCFLMGTGDAIAQIAIEKRHPMQDYSLRRTVKFSIIGLTLVGPSLSVWYSFLAKKFGEKVTGTAVLKKVAFDQLIFAPCFIPIFLTSVGLVNGKALPEITNDIKRDYLDILKANYMLFPAVQLVNFYLIPLKHQVLLVQMVALIWNTYLSWKTQSSI